MFIIDNFAHNGVSVDFDVVKGDIKEHFMVNVDGLGSMVVTEESIFKEFLTESEFELLLNFVVSCIDICNKNYRVLSGC